MDKRGVIVTDYSTDDQGRVLEHRLDSNSLRYYLLYWDEIEYPATPLLGLSMGDLDVEYLQRCGILTRTFLDYQLPKSLHGTHYHPMVAALLQYESLVRRHKAHPGAWCLAQKGAEQILPASDDLIEKSNIRMIFNNALPSPPSNVPLDDILEFKNKRLDELQRLRHALDKLFLNAYDSNDVPTATRVSLRNLEDAIECLHKVVNETWSTKILSTIKVDINIPGVVITAASAEVLGQSFGFSPGVGAAIGSALSSVRFEATPVSNYRKLPDSIVDYAYLHSMEFEIGVP